MNKWGKIFKLKSIGFNSLEILFKWQKKNKSHLGLLHEKVVKLIVKMESVK